MQRFEDYHLMGTRQDGASPARLAALADDTVRRGLLEMTKQHREPTAEPSPRRQKPAPRPASPAFENRPSATVAHGGSARLGGDLAWALRELRKADPAVLRREIRRDPGAWALALANLERLTAQAASRGWRPHC